MILRTIVLKLHTNVVLGVRESGNEAFTKSEMTSTLVAWIRLNILISNWKLCGYGLMERRPTIQTTIDACIASNNIKGCTRH